jgi:hypothetical protein
MPAYIWILIWAAAIGVLAFFTIREHRSGRRVAPNAVTRRREDTFRMHAAGEHYDMPKKDPNAGRST